METVIALAVWAVVAVSALGLWNYTSRAATRLADRQDAFENARAAMDALLMNLQLAETVKLQTDASGMLKRLELTEPDPDGKLAPYIFYFNAGAIPGQAKYHRLEFGLNDEFASRLAEVRLKDDGGGQLTLTVVTDDEEATRLVCVADVRYKDVSVAISP